MPIIKSPELEEWLRGLNYEILGVSLLFGDWIEVAIDWLLQPISYLADWFEQAYNWFVDFRDEVIEWITKTIADINEIWIWFSTEIQAWWGQLAEWWAGTKYIILSWIDTAVAPLTALQVAWDNFWTITFPQWTGKLDKLRAEWDNFWVVIYPNLISFQWLTTWWNTQLETIDRLITSRLTEWLPFYNSLAELWTSVAEFITDPLGWLEARFTDWFLGAE